MMYRIIGALAGVLAIARHSKPTSAVRLSVADDARWHRVQLVDGHARPRLRVPTESL